MKNLIEILTPYFNGRIIFSEAGSIVWRSVVLSERLAERR